MTVRQTIKHILKQPGDAFYYWQGTLRYAILTGRGRWGWLARWLWVRQHIREQFEWRKQQASGCYNNGECRCCGCPTPDLFLADKACRIGHAKYPHCADLGNGQPCYPRMMNRRNWEAFKRTDEWKNSQSRTK